MKIALALGLTTATLIVAAAWSRPPAGVLPVVAAITIADSAPPTESMSTSQRRLFGVWLLAVAGATVGLQVRQQRGRLSFKLQGDPRS